MNAVIVSVGTELVGGTCVDTNASWLSAELGQFGIPVIQHTTVGDVESNLADTLRGALVRSDLVIVTGGLGPTPDDVTRQAIASATGRPLVECPQARAQITSLFQRLKRRMTEADQRQAQIPRGGRSIANPRGTAPGIQLYEEGKHLIAMPGVPSEMKEMFLASVRPMLRDWMGDACIRTERLLCFGISEATIGGNLADLMGRDRNPLVGTTATEGVIAVHLTATGADPDDADRMIHADVAEVKERLGRTVFGRGDDSLAVVVAGLLTRSNRTLAAAESCTGGLLAKQLTDVPGSSAYFLQGYVTYSNESKVRLLDVPKTTIAEDGAVSEAVARAMAVGCRNNAGSDLALSITGIAGPGGGSPPDKPVGLVHLGLADAERVETKQVLFGEHLSRSQIRDRSCKAALNWLRLRLISGDRER